MPQGAERKNLAGRQVVRRWALDLRSCQYGVLGSADGYGRLGTDAGSCTANRSLHWPRIDDRKNLSDGYRITGNLCATVPEYLTVRLMVDDRNARQAIVDVLSAVLRELRFESAGYQLVQLGSPFGIVFDKPGLRGMHVVVRGQCELVFDDGTIEELTAGDLVVFPRGDFHTLRSPARAAPRLISGDFATPMPGSELRTGHCEIDTVVVCAAFVTSKPDHPALRGMPRAVHVSGDLDRPRPWLAPLIDALALEATDGGPGSELAMARLLEALLIRALRDHDARIEQPGWLAGLRDPFVATALAALHEDPARPWTLATLARTVGLSRAAFAARFSAHVGEPAMRYLLDLRIQRAKALLRETRFTVATIAGQVGYQSDVAFAAAFKREVGTSPGAYRRKANRTGLPADRRASAPTKPLQ